MSAFGERLRTLREEKSLTQVDLAKLLKTANSTISQYESNKRSPDKGTIERLADFFNVPVDYLLGRSNTKKIDLLDVLEDNTTQISAAGKLVTPEQRVEILKTLDEDRPKTNYEEMYKHPMLADLLMRVPDLTDEEKESLAEHLEVALVLIERERQKRKQRGEL